MSTLVGAAVATALPETTALAALSKLARKGAYAVPVRPKPGAPTAFAVFSPRNGFAHALAFIAGETIALALGRGWLEADQEPGRFRLSSSGAKALRRARSGPPASPAPNRASAAPARPKPSSATAQTRAPQEAPLAWLARRRDKDGQPLISAVQFSAGERLATDFWHAQFFPRVTSNWSGRAISRRERRAAPDAGRSMSDGVVAARERINHALAAVGPELADILVDVCCYEVGLEAAGQAHGWPQRSAKVVLELALTRLARHYGLIAPQPASGRVRHWGGADYRPTLDGWQS
jgi:Domain of unknown function (DUF6456)